jgi:hypothetical protein
VLVFVFGFGFGFSCNYAAQVDLKAQAILLSSFLSGWDYRCSAKGVFGVCY